MYVSLNENEELIVQEIVPGGPAARTEIIEKGDQVIKVSPKKGEELLVSCNSKVETEKPAREISIPKGAFWVGNAENGHWFKIEEIHNHKNNAKISIFDGKNGVRLVSKKFILVCSNNSQVFIKNLENEIKSYDGLKIHLKSGCWLQ